MFLFAVLLPLCLPSGIALYSPPSLNTSHITQENYESLVDGSAYLWMLLSYVPDCKSCEKFASSFEEIVSGFQGILKLGLLNTEEQPQLKKALKLEKHPTFKFIDPSFPSPRTYNGELVKEKLIDYIFKLLLEKVERQSGVFKPEGRVIELNDGTFKKKVLESEEPWLVQFYAPWCTHCQKFGPTYVQIAKELKKKIKCGAVDATSNKQLAETYNIQYFPTLKYFPARIKEKDFLKEFTGSYSKDKVITWAHKMKSKDLPVNITQITDEDALKTACGNTPLCIISFLPPMSECEVSCRHKYLNDTSLAAEKFCGNEWGWVWSEAGAQSEIEKALDVGGSGYPTMVAVSIKKMKYSILRGPYTTNGIMEFLKGVPSGKWEALPIKVTKMPEINFVEPWDGSDVVVKHPHLDYESQIDNGDVDDEGRLIKDEL